ncbi:unnamed protein product [Thelazia callipaeda]|uniref:TSP1_CCN domain-containing protein n=1 Tax=Thelazia callipaeda TaxID=103827 RepID=A0A0N5D810_THECL|nr:unnamed protein product [Thelazia callipaeda]
MEWSECSATCWTGTGKYPQMYRKVNESSIVHARNGGQPECPPNLLNYIDEAPCNTYRCPTSLASYAYGKQCYYNDATLKNKSGCYQIRNVPLDDRLILIDANLTKPCDCPAVIY